MKTVILSSVVNVCLNDITLKNKIYTTLYSTNDRVLAFSPYYSLLSALMPFDSKMVSMRLCFANTTESALDMASKGVLSTYTGLIRANEHNISSDIDSFRIINHYMKINENVLEFSSLFENQVGKCFYLEINVI